MCATGILSYPSPGTLSYPSSNPLTIGIPLLPQLRNPGTQRGIWEGKRITLNLDGRGWGWERLCAFKAALFV